MNLLRFLEEFKKYFNTDYDVEKCLLRLYSMDPKSTEIFVLIQFLGNVQTFINWIRNEASLLKCTFMEILEIEKIHTFIVEILNFLNITFNFDFDKKLIAPKSNCNFESLTSKHESTIIQLEEYRVSLLKSIKQ